MKNVTRKILLISLLVLCFSSNVWATVADENYDDDTIGATTSNDGWDYVSNDGGATLEINTALDFTGKSYFFISAGAGTQTQISFKTTDGSEFKLNGAKLGRGFGDWTGFTIKGYKDGSEVSGASLSPSPSGNTYTLDVSADSNWQDIDEVRIWGDDLDIELDDIDVSDPVKVEPSNHPTGFIATADSASQITTAWIDSTGGTLPDGYLVLCNLTGTFADPVDGIAQSDDTTCVDGNGVMNVAHGSGGSYAWTGLNSGTQYYYKIFPYSNAGAAIDYKIDAVPGTANATTIDLTSGTTIQSIGAGMSAVLRGVQISNNIGSSCQFTVIYSATPPGGGLADPGEMPMQWDITTDCGTPNVDLVFNYTDIEVAGGNNITESNLKVFKHVSGTTWNNEGGLAAIGSQTVTLTSVTALSDWTIGDPTSSGNDKPTAVSLQSITATNNSAIIPILIATLMLLLAGGVALRRRA